MALYEEWKESILPAIRKDISNNLTSEQILKKYEALGAAVLLTRAATSKNENVQLNAAIQLLDRLHGKPVQKQEHAHRLQELSEEEMLAMIKSKMIETNIVEQDEE